MSVRFYLPLCCGRTAPEVSQEKCSYASHFNHWFLESFKSCFLLFMALPGLIDTLAQLLAWRSLPWLSMTWRRRYLIQNHFLSTTLPTTWLFYSVRRSLCGGRKYKHTHTHTHTHKGCYFLESAEKDKQVIFLYFVYKSGIILPTSILVLGFPGLVLEKASQTMIP